MIMQNIDGYQRHDISTLGNEFYTLRHGQMGFDLDVLQRSDKDILVIGQTKSTFLTHKENVVEITKFEGTSEDDVLLQLIPLLSCKRM